MTTTRVNQTNGGGFHTRPHKVEMAGFAVLLALCNLPGAQPLLTFLPSAVARGEWWRWLTHAFTHITWYHLLLDGAAFLFLYASLREPSRACRLAYVAGGIAVSVLLASWFAPAVGTLGLCGLSGVAHGLTAITALEMIRNDERLGWACLATVAGKAVWEAATGHVVFEWLHFGRLGTPIAISHLGGVVGGLLSWWAGLCVRDSVFEIGAAVRN